MANGMGCRDEDLDRIMPDHSRRLPDRSVLLPLQLPRLVPSKLEELRVGAVVSQPEGILAMGQSVPDGSSEGPVEVAHEIINMLDPDAEPNQILRHFQSRALDR